MQKREEITALLFAGRNRSPHSFVVTLSHFAPRTLGDLAIDLCEQLQDPITYQTPELLALLAEARGDTTGAAEWRTRRDAAYAEAQERAGPPSMPTDLVQLASLALTARQQNLPSPTPWPRPG